MSLSLSYSYSPQTKLARLGNRIVIGFQGPVLILLLIVFKRAVFQGAETLLVDDNIG